MLAGLLRQGSGCRRCIGVVVFVGPVLAMVDAAAAAVRAGGIAAVDRRRRAAAPLLPCVLAPAPLPRRVPAAVVLGPAALFHIVAGRWR